MERKLDPVAFFTERSLAAYLAVSERTVRNWIHRGDLPSYKLGAARRIDPADVEDFSPATGTRRHEARVSDQTPQSLRIDRLGGSVHGPRWQAPHRQANLESRQGHVHPQVRRSACD
jgi:excisionase family DNA binding protein